MSVAMAITKEFYANNTDSFMLVASDSDYWAMLDQLPEANFLMMVEREKCSPYLGESNAVDRRSGGIYWNWRE